MADHVRTRAGAVLLHRLGPLQMGEQSAWNRAPASRGLWAFPWPLFEMFFAYHQYGYAAPARLRTEKGQPTHPSAWVDDDGNPPPADVDVSTLADDDHYQVRDGFHAERETWVRTVGRRTVRRHEFWYAGDLYTHLTERGEILALDQWRRMPAVTFAAAVRRSGANRIIMRSQDQVSRHRTAADHLEVFLPHGVGRITGRVRT